MKFHQTLTRKNMDVVLFIHILIDILSHPAWVVHVQIKVYIDGIWERNRRGFDLFVLPSTDFYYFFPSIKPTHAFQIFHLPLFFSRNNNPKMYFVHCYQIGILSHDAQEFLKINFKL